MPEPQKDLSAIYAEQYPRIVRYLRRLVGDADAEDVAQEVFVKVGQALDGFRGESKLSTWIYRIATNTAMDHLRRPSSAPAVRQASSAGDDDAAPDDELIADGAPLHDDVLIRKDMNACIRGLVDGLPEMYRTVLVLADLEELTNGEISEVTGLPLDTVKIRLHRARQQLRKKMDRACHITRDGRSGLSCDRKPAAPAFAPR